MSDAALMLIAVFLPAVGAIAIRLAGAWPNVREAVTLVVAALLFTTLVQLLPAAQAGLQPNVALQEIVPGIAIKFTLEPLGMLFALIASGLWFVTSVYAMGYMRAHHEQNQTRFYVCFAAALASTMGIAFRRQPA